MSFTAKQVEEAISEYEDGDNYLDGGYGGVLKELKGEGNWSDKEFSIDVPGLPKLEYIDSYGGEGQGDDYWLVFRVGDQYFRKDGWYASYDGGYLDGELYEVKPVEVTVINYEKV